MQSTQTPPTGLPHPKTARQAAGLTAQKLAELAGVGMTTVFRCEKSGAYPVHFRQRAAYLAALGLTEPTSSPAGA